MQAVAATSCWSKLTLLISCVFSPSRIILRREVYLASSSLYILSCVNITKCPHYIAPSKNILPVEFIFRYVESSFFRLYCDGAPCGLWEFKNRPDPFLGWMSYVTKPDFGC